MLKDALIRMVDVFAPSVLMQGQDYQQKGFVLNIRLSDGLLKARVKGRSSQIYDVHIDLKVWPNKHSQCSCQQINCKHAAASFFALQVKENLSLQAPVSQTTQQQSLNNWLQSLRENQSAELSTANTHEVIYLLEIVRGEYDHKILVRFALAKRLKRGGSGKKVVFNSITANRKQYFTDKDEEIIQNFLAKYGPQNGFERFPLRNSDLLEKILSTHRAFLIDEEEEETVSLGEPLNADLRWQLERNGNQKLIFEQDACILMPLILDRLWYFNPDKLSLGLLHTSLLPSDLKFLLSTPTVSLEQAADLAEKLAKNFPTLPKPQHYGKREVLRLTPQPIIRLDALALKNEQKNSIDYLCLRELCFDYDGISVDARDTASSLFRSEKETLVQITRNKIFEQKIKQECAQLLPVRAATFHEKISALQDLTEVDVLMHYQQVEDLSRLHNQVIPLLKRKGWQVVLAHPYYAEILEADEIEWFSDVQEKGHDFFSYALGILVDGKQVSIVPLVADLIAKMSLSNLEEMPDETMVFLNLPEGKRLQIAMARIKPLLRFLIHYGAQFAENEAVLQLKRYQLILMRETEQAIAATNMRWKGGEQFREQLRQLIDMQISPVSLPKNVCVSLRDYQHYGLSWLQFLRENRFGGVLADDMGLGKTIQTLVHLQLEKEQGRLSKASLIVAPTSLVMNWFEEAKRFTPQLKCLVFHGTARSQDEFANYDVIISTYGLIQRDKLRFTHYQFYYLILDEAQFIKNARAKTTQIIQQIQAVHRLCLTGTPLENHVGELWSLFHFLMPGLLGDNKQFRRFFKIPIEKNQDFARQQLLANRVKPFMLRRSKNQVVKELPAKTEITHSIELAGAQRDLYEAIRMSMEKKVRTAIARQGLGKSHIVLLDALLKLRQVCCDPRLLTIPEAQMAYGVSAKLHALMALLDNLVAEGRRVLVFSQFTSMLKLIEEQLLERQYTYVKLTGQTQNRQQVVNSFQEGQIPIFLISLKAGGTGLNLTRADTVIHYDPWWNPAAEDQATDRSHRIGQESPVFVYKLITSGTVEEAILAMQHKKRQLFEGILSENASGLALTSNDVEQFFMPLAEE